MAVVIRCPHCKTKFRWLAETEDYPKDCPECGEYVGHDRADDDVAVPNILSFSNRCVDGVYRMEERMSRERMHQAAEMAGCDASEMKDLQVTNMRDNLKQGDIAAMPVQNAVTQQMDHMRAINPNTQVGHGVSQGHEYALAAASGRIADGVSGSILPRRGSQMQSVVHSQHGGRQEAVRQMTLERS